MENVYIKRQLLSSNWLTISNSIIIEFESYMTSKDASAKENKQVSVEVKWISQTHD